MWIPTGGNFGAGAGFDLWQGKILGHVAFEGAVENIFADKPGSVWILTQAGLSHLTAPVPPAPARPTDYKLTATMTVESTNPRLLAPGNGGRTAYSAYGGLTNRNAGAVGRRAGYLAYLTPLKPTP